MYSTQKKSSNNGLKYNYYVHICSEMVINTTIMGWDNNLIAQIEQSASFIPLRGVP